MEMDSLMINKMGLLIG